MIDRYRLRVDDRNKMECRSNLSYIHTPCPCVFGPCWCNFGDTVLKRCIVCSNNSETPHTGILALP